jgi:hypothetical protein
MGYSGGLAVWHFIVLGLLIFRYAPSRRFRMGGMAALLLLLA